MSEKRSGKWTILRRIAWYLLVGLIIVMVVWYLFGPRAIGPVTEASLCRECQGYLDSIYSGMMYDLKGGPVKARAFFEKEWIQDCLSCPTARRTRKGNDYEFVFDIDVWKREEAPPLPLGWDDAPRHSGCRNVLFQGGEVRKLTEEEFEVQRRRLTERNISIWHPGPDERSFPRAPKP